MDGREHYGGTRPKTLYGELYELGLGIRGRERVTKIRGQESDACVH